MANLPMSIKRKICKFQTSNNKLYDSKVTRKYGPNVLPTTGKPRGRTAPENDAIMRNCGKRICGMHPYKLVSKTVHLGGKTIITRFVNGLNAIE